jgi:hypothetical protein
MPELQILTTEIKINGFKSLPAGWCYGDGVVFLQETIDKALDVIKIAENYNLDTDAFPGVSGEIEVHFYKGTNKQKFHAEDEELGLIEEYKEEDTLEIIISNNIVYYSISDDDYMPASLELITKWCKQ